MAAAVLGVVVVVLRAWLLVRIAAAAAAVASCLFAQQFLGFLSLGCRLSNVVGRPDLAGHCSVVPGRRYADEPLRLSAPSCSRSKLTISRRQLGRSR